MAKKRKVKSIKTAVGSSENKLIKAVSVIDYIYGVIVIIAALFLLLGGTIFASLGGTFIIEEMMPSFMAAGIGGMLIILAIFLAAAGVVHIYLGKAIKEKKLWAKVLQIILAIVPAVGTFGGLFSFPLGTASGIFMIWILLIKKETRDLFK